MGVSKNRDTPRSSMLIGFSIINHPFWCFFPYFWKHPYKNSSFLCKPQLLTSGFQPRKTVNLEGEHVFFNSLLPVIRWRCCGDDAWMSQEVRIKG